MGNILQQFAAIWNKLGINQRVTIIMMMVGLVAGVTGLVVISQRPSYELLYADLDDKDVAKLVGFFKESNVPFRVTNGGRSVMVAEGAKYDVKAQLAAKNITPQSSHEGLELIASNGWASTPSQEQIIQRRAMQGELSRVIMHMQPIEWADVQIAQGEKGSFVEDDVDSTAAITVRLKPGRSLRPIQIVGIQELVAGSVQGLKSENVTLIDDGGNLLSTAERNTANARAGSVQSYRAAVEQELVGKAQSLLDRALGAGRAEVRVTADVDMNVRSEVRESFDLNGRFATQEEITTSTSTSTSAAGTPTSTSEEKSNAQYQTPKVITNLETAPGTIKKIDVAVILDPYYADAEGKEQQLTQQELDDLSKLVQAAVGYASERKDTFQLTTMRFMRVAAPAAESKPGHSREGREYWLKMARNGSPLLAVGLFVAFGFFALRKISKAPRIVDEDALYMSVPSSSDSDGDGRGGEGLAPSGVSLAAQAGVSNRVREIIGNDPVTAARLLQSWLEEEK